MECPFCGAELICIDYYGYRQVAEHYYIYPQSWIEKEGDIYKCPNSDGFENLEEAKKYLEENEKELGNINLEEVCCYCNCFNGYFYTNSKGTLFEGYPC